MDRPTPAPPHTTPPTPPTITYLPAYTHYPFPLPTLQLLAGTTHLWDRAGAHLAVAVPGTATHLPHGSLLPATPHHLPHCYHYPAYLPPDYHTTTTACRTHTYHTPHPASPTSHTHLYTRHILAFTPHHTHTHTTHPHLHQTSLRASHAPLARFSVPVTTIYRCGCALLHASRTAARTPTHCILHLRRFHTYGYLKLLHRMGWHTFLPLLLHWTSCGGFYRTRTHTTAIFTTSYLPPPGLFE